MAEVTGYTRSQIWLHWVVAVLIALQYLLNEPISEAWEALQDGGTFAFQPLIAAHVAGGSLVLLLVLWRLGLRATHGAPPPPAAEPAPLRRAARLAHGTLYALMLAMPLSGLAAWFGGVVQAAAVHNVLKVVLLVLIVVHVLAALLHQFVLKTNLMLRMKRPAV